MESLNSSSTSKKSNQQSVVQIDTKTEEEKYSLTELIKSTKENINSSIKGTNSIFKKKILKSLVSKKKFRFEHEGFDLDLTYITERIIAMGFPANNIEKIFRNGKEEVKQFFNQRHNEKYKVYNLCSERTYPENTFHLQAHYPFDDHNPPPFDLMIPFCEDLHEWLNKDPLNIAAVHCKAGKGRTGTLICCYLLYSGFIKTAEDALTFYGIMRTENGKGVTIPSQLRYVYYFEHAFKLGIKEPINAPMCMVTKIKLFTVPMFQMVGNGCTPYFNIYNEKSEYDYRNKNKLQTYKNEASIEFKVNNFSVSGDVCIAFYNKNTIGKYKMFRFWFNTYFIPNNGILAIKKSMLDWACKDSNNKQFDPNFKIEVHFIILDENYGKNFAPTISNVTTALEYLKLDTKQIVDIKYQKFIEQLKAGKCITII